MLKSNIYLIENLEQLSCKYRRYSIRGIPKDAPDYEKHMQQLVQILSRETRSPCVIIKENDQPFVVQPVESKDIPDSVDVAGTKILIQKEEGERELHFDDLSDNDANIAIGFLEFSLKGPLYASHELWLPKSSSICYQRTPDEDFRNLSRGVDMFKGFRFKLIRLPNNQIGISIDVSRKYISRDPLPSTITEDDFRKYKHKKCVYEYGKNWYEIRIASRHDQLTADELELPNGKSLFKDVHDKAMGQKSERLLALPKNSTVLIYYTSDNQPRHVPSGLCRLTYKTSHPSVKRIHHKAMMPPHMRDAEIKFIVDNYFRKMKFQGVPIFLSHKTYEPNEERFSMPDLKFGNNQILTIKDQHSGKVHIPLAEHGQTKKSMLFSKEAGFFIKKKLDAQYIILPKSVHESYGKQFLSDLIQETNKIYPQPDGKTYEPTIITYDDSVEKSIANLGRAILDAVQNNFSFSGFGLVIIPRLPSTRFNKEDELANLIMSELRKRGIYVSVAHTDVPSRSYTRVHAVNGGHWKLVDDGKIISRFRGYLTNVVINKIMILNSCWPFVLAQQMHSDLVIGIDVKNNTAGFTFVYKNQKLRSYHSDSDHKEQLGKKQLETKIYNSIKEEYDRDPIPLKKITIHRDGRIFQNEILGMKKAFERLATEGILDKDYSCNFLSITKSSRIPLRLFDVKKSQGSQFEKITNPTIGTYLILFDQAFLCSTGKPYWYPGTTAPLHVIKMEGDMDFKSLLEEVFWLSCLTWTRIDYCLKLPISIKITDIRLREVAGEYDEDALKFGEEED